MATTKSIRKPKTSAEDDRLAKGRFMDQPGQFINKTPKSVMKKRAQGLAALAKQMEARKKKEASTKKGKK